LINYAEALSKNYPDSAIITANIVITKAKQLNEPSLEGQAHLILAYCNEMKSEYKVSLMHFLKAAEIFKTLNDKARLARCYNGMGIIYWYQGFPDKAIEYYKKNIQYSLELKDQFGVAASYGNIAIIFDEKGDLDNAIDYYNKALAIFETQDKPSQVAACYDNLSLIFKQKNEYKKALEYNAKSYKIRDRILDTLGMLASMENLGGILIKLNRIDEAIQVSERVLSIASRKGAKEDMKYALANLKDAYEAKGNYKMANQMITKLMNLKDSLRSVENSSQIAELEAKYKNKEKETELHELKLIQKYKEKENADKMKKKNYFIFIVSFFGLLLLFIAFLLFKRSKEKQQIAEAIAKKNSAIEEQKIIIDKAFAELTEKSKDILDSIKYAKRIQSALLPTTKYVSETLSQTNTDYFILFKPKDIVSGDFYWMIKRNDDLFYITADCTGHGVPGAFMSMLSINLLNQIVVEQNTDTTSQIFNKLREMIIKSLKTDDLYSKDGLDAIACKLSFSDLTLEYTAANNPIYLIRNNELEVLASQKSPIGYSEFAEPFISEVIQLQKGDCLYTITDGFADQFGGEKGKKFKYKQLKDLLLEIHHLPMKEQHDKLISAFESWKGELEQVDDVCIIGMRV
jgi:serine phosphatase RsbU (regulator of sigma subunit)